MMVPYQTCLSKILEKPVVTQLTEHKNKHNLREPMESAYCKHCSCETAMLCICNDVLQAQQWTDVTVPF